MNKNDYIDKATEKIYDYSAKKAVKAELEEHIDEKTEYFNEIGYKGEEAEEKASLAMGDAEEVCEQFGAIHNDFHNPAADIIILACLFGLFGAIYYLLQRFAFGDGGMISLLFAASCLSFTAVYSAVCLALKRSRAISTVLSVILICGAGAFNWYVLSQADRHFGGQLNKLSAFMFKALIPSMGYYPNKKRIIVACCAVLSVAVISLAFAVIYQIKVNRLCNSRADNKIKNFLTSLCNGIAFFSFVLFVLLSAKCVMDLKSIKSEYCRVYDFVIETIDKSNTQEDIINCIKKSDIAFEETHDAKGNLIGYNYYHNLVYLDYSFEEPKSIEAVRAEQEEQLNNLLEEYKEMYSERTYQAAMKEYADLFDEILEANTNEAYYSQEYCSVYFSANTTLFNKSFDSVSTSFIEQKNGKENDVYSYESYIGKNGERYEYYKSIIPSSFSAKYTLGEIESCKIQFKFVTGEGIYKKSEVVDACRLDESTRQFYREIDEALEIISQNSLKSRDEIASLTGSRLEKPSVSQEDYEKGINTLGSYFDEYKDTMRTLYDFQNKFCFDNWVFFLTGAPFESIYVYDSYSNLLLNKSIDNTPVYSKYLSDDVNEKVSVNGGFFDKEGNFRFEPDSTAYYTPEGRKFYLSYKTVKDENGRDEKEYYLSDRNGKYYPVERCYIDENGCLFYDLSGNIKYEEESEKYSSPNGTKYTKALQTSWDENGKMIFINDIK